MKNFFFAFILVVTVGLLPKLSLALPSNFEETKITGGLNLPTAMAFLPDGQLLVAEKRGTLRVLTNEKLQTKTVISLSVATDKERGLLGIAVDPNYSTNHYIYLYYTRLTPSIKNRVSRFTLSQSDAGDVQASHEKILLDNIASDAGIHNGGAMHFGVDGKLYIAVGDGGAKSNKNGQSLTTLSGKILRINSDGLIPSDNPFANRAGVKKQIWAYGLRNPFTFGIDPKDGRTYINDVGSAYWEEINDGHAGANFGWPTCEGKCQKPGLSNPIYQYEHGKVAAITGGTFYRGTMFPERYAGSYFFGDYSRGFIKELRTNGSMVPFHPKARSPVDIAVGPDQAMYYLSIGGGAVYKLTYTEGNKAPIAALKVKNPRGLSPLKVTFDASKSTDPEGEGLTYQWVFGDGQKATGAKVMHTYRKQGRFRASVTVRDGSGNKAIRSKVIEVGNPPDASITVPARSKKFRLGETIRFAGTATDKEDGQLSAARFSWRVTLEHNVHNHPYAGPFTNSKSGSFTVGSNLQLEEDMQFRVWLTVTDKSGLKTTVFRDVYPQ